MRNFKGDKKGFMLGEETLKIIIAVICIVFLISILVAIYNSNTSAGKIEQAKEILTRISTIISSLKEGTAETQDIPNPEGWHLYSFTGGEKPNSCLNDNCICICATSLIKIITPQTKKCDDEGSCLVISNLITSDLDLKITGTDPLIFIGIKKQNGQILIGEAK
jgi:hypothetical protein